MKKYIPIVLIFILGLGIFLYPTVSNIIASKTQSSEISSYEKEVESIDAAEIEAMKKAAWEYNQSLGSLKITDPFDDSQKNDDDVYYSLLNLDDIMGYAEIPKINVYLPIYHGTSAEVIAKGIGHIQGTSLPVGGENTHCVLSSHRGLPAAKLFTDLDKMEIGNVFYLHILDETLVYKIDQIVVVEPTDITALTIEKGKDYVTLLTCTPYSINSHRMLVRGVRTDEAPTDDNYSFINQFTGEIFNIEAYWLILIVAVPLIIISLAVIKASNEKWRTNRRKAKEEEDAQENEENKQ